MLMTSYSDASQALFDVSVLPEVCTLLNRNLRLLWMGGGVPAKVVTPSQSRGVGGEGGRAGGRGGVGGGLRGRESWYERGRSAISLLDVKSRFISCVLRYRPVSPFACPLTYILKAGGCRATRACFAK